MKVLITGGCSGLGKCLTELFIKDGHSVIATYKNSVDNALEMENELENLRCFKLDINNEEEIKNFFFKEIDDIDLVINNAAIAKDMEINELTKKDFMSVIGTNTIGTFMIVRESINLMKKGIIVNISSDNTIDNYNPISLAYDVSKCGVNMITKEFANINSDVKVLAIAPGWINTSSVREMNPDYLKSEMAKNGQSELIDPTRIYEDIISIIKDESIESGSIVAIRSDEEYYVWN